MTTPEQPGPEDVEVVPARAHDAAWAQLGEKDAIIVRGGRVLADELQRNGVTIRDAVIHGIAFALAARDGINRTDEIVPEAEQFLGDNVTRLLVMNEPPAAMPPEHTPPPAA